MQNNHSYYSDAPGQSMPYGQPQGQDHYEQSPYGQVQGQNPYGQAPYRQPKQSPFTKRGQFFTSGKAGRKTPGVRQIIAAALVFISLLFYLCGGWIKLPKTIYGVSIEHYYSVMYPMAKGALNTPGYNHSIQSWLSDYGISMNTDKYANGILYMLKTIRDGKFSMGELAGDARVLNSLSKDLGILKALTNYDDDFDDESFENEDFSDGDLSDLSDPATLINLLEEISDAVRIGAILLTLLNIAVVLLAILAMLWILAGPSDQKTIAMIPYACSFIISFIISIVLVVKFNKFIP